MSRILYFSYTSYFRWRGLAARVLLFVGFATRLAWKDILVLWQYFILPAVSDIRVRNPSAANLRFHVSHTIILAGLYFPRLRYAQPDTSYTC
ncbi:hypothetical protein [Pontibacter kalidii]|uniref:hypothetical protein n=1 Tax=Pontibacter kalidii TaxID=2592049 RepID=UPI00224EDBE9|nr:hypothetical protein [Pontibacter kalidii]